MVDYIIYIYIYIYIFTLIQKMLKNLKSNIKISYVYFTIYFFVINIEFGLFVITKRTCIVIFALHYFLKFHKNKII
jgi:hypothetical protein